MLGGRDDDFANSSCDKSEISGRTSVFFVVSFVDMKVRLCKLIRIERSVSDDSVSLQGINIAYREGVIDV